MTTRRARDRGPRRASLVRLFVVLGALLSLCASTLTAQNAALGVAFAQACMAEEARTHQNEPRLRMEREDAHGGDVHALARATGSGEKVLRRSRVAGRPDPHVEGALPGPFVVAELSRYRDPASVANPGVRSLPTDSPTRARARLMVFLN